MYTSWSSGNENVLTTRNDLCSFLDRACLKNFYKPLKKKLRIVSPNQFAYFKPSDLFPLGLTYPDINRLINQLIEDDLPVGNLLTDQPGDNIWSDCVHSTYNHRFKALRKLFNRRSRYSMEIPNPVLHPSRPSSASIINNNNNNASHASYNKHKQQPTQVLSGHHHHLLQTNLGHSYHQLSDMSLGDGEEKRHETTTTTTTTTSSPKRDLMNEGSENLFTSLIPEQDIKLHSRLGTGSSGIVRRGDWRTYSGKIIPVAVKLLHSNVVSDHHFFTAFLHEVRAMQCLSHPNLIRLHGVVLSNPIMIVTELAPLGNLLLHLRAQSLCNRNASSVSTATTTTTTSNNNLPLIPRALQVDSLWSVGVQIARGMAYLTDQGLVHRDLAARNILLAGIQSDEVNNAYFPVVKIADFGLVRSVRRKNDATLSDGDVNDGFDSTDVPGRQAKVDGGDVRNKNCNIYKGCVGQKIPFAWSAPESIRHCIFSQASDVWSFGVTLWEIWTGGAEPWARLDLVQLLKKLESDVRLPWPSLTCPRRLYQLMLACWRKEPERRPTFQYLAMRLGQISPFKMIASQNLDEADRLGLEAGDLILVLDGKSQKFWWRGQNVRTGEIGLFPQAIARSLCSSSSDHDQSKINDLIHNNKRQSQNEFRRSKQLDSSETDKWFKLNLETTSRDTATNTSQFYYQFGGSVEERSWSISSQTTTTSSANYTSASIFTSNNNNLLEESRTIELNRYDDSDDLDIEWNANSNTIQSPNSNPNRVLGYSSIDERLLLDRTNDGRIGLNGYNLNFVELGSKKHSKNVVYSANPTQLPAPPGPDDFSSGDDKLSSTSTLLIGDLLCTTDDEEEEGDGGVDEAQDDDDSVFDKIIGCSTEKSRIFASTPTASTTTAPAAVSATTNTTSSAFSCKQNVDDVCEPSAPPFIDFNTFVPPSTHFLFTPRYHVTIPSAPIYTSFNPQPPTQFILTGRSQQQYNNQLNNNNTTTYNNMSNMSSTYNSTDPDTIWRNDLKNPFKSSNPLSPTNSASVLHNMPTLSKHPPTCNTIRLENQLLVGNSGGGGGGGGAKSKADNNFGKFEDTLKKFDCKPAFNSVSNEYHHQINVQKSLSRSQSSSIDGSDENTDISILCNKQNGGCTQHEARSALNFINYCYFSSQSRSFITTPPPVSSYTPPGVSVETIISQLDWPPISPVNNSNVTGFDSVLNHHPNPHQTTRFYRIELANRFILVSRLYELGLIDWDSCLQLLMMFNWNLEVAGDWILDHLVPN